MQFLPQLRLATGLPIYLETGGHRPEQLAMILPYLDSVGMDLKLPSSGRKSVAGTCGISQALSPVISRSVCQGDYF